MKPKITFIGSIVLDDDGSFRGLYKVEGVKHGREALAAFVDEIGGGGSCGHEYDCCGCYSYHAPEIIQHERIYKYFIIQQAGYRNI